MHIPGIFVARMLLLYLLKMLAGKDCRKHGR